MTTLRRALVLLGLGSLLGILFAAYLQRTSVLGEEAPPELKAKPPQPTRTAKDLSRPIIEATRKVRPAVVQITGYNYNWRRQLRPSQSGSGFIISSKGHVLTNRHVIKGVAQLVIQLSDGRTFEHIQVIGADPRSDVAVLRILDLDDDALPIAPLGDSDSLEVGELVLAIGAPFGLESSVSMGVVSATGRADLLGSGSSEDFIQTDAALNRGNSGGPLVNLAGQVVGINTAIENATGSNVGIGFSIPINLARAVSIALIEEGKVRHGYLGVNGEFLNATQLDRLKIKAPGGLKLSRVLKHSPAARAGLKAGDVITGVDGRPLKNLGILHARLAQAGPGGKLELTIRRDAATRKVSVLLGEERVDAYGIEVATLTPGRAVEIGLPRNTTGAIVTRVQKESVAGRASAKNRLLPGDVIVRIDWPGYSARINRREDFQQVMRHLATRPPREVEFIIRTKEGLFKVRLSPGRGA